MFQKKFRRSPDSRFQLVVTIDGLEDAHERLEIEFDEIFKGFSRVMANLPDTLDDFEFRIPQRSGFFDKCGIIRRRIADPLGRFHNAAGVQIRCQGDAFQGVVYDLNDISFFQQPLDFQYFEALGPNQCRVQNVKAVGGQHGEHFVQGGFPIDQI